MVSLTDHSLQHSSRFRRFSLITQIQLWVWVVSSWLFVNKVKTTNKYRFWWFLQIQILQPHPRFTLIFWFTMQCIHRRAWTIPFSLRFMVKTLSIQPFLQTSIVIRTATHCTMCSRGWHYSRWKNERSSRSVPDPGGDVVCAGFLCSLFIMTGERTATPTPEVKNIRGK